MDKYDWVSFFRFLEEANNEELTLRKEKTRIALAVMEQGGAAHSDVKRMLRFIDEEQLSRLNLAQVSTTGG